MKTRRARSLTAAGSPPGMPIYAHWTALAAIEHTTIDNGVRHFGNLILPPSTQALKEDHVPGNTSTILGHVAEMVKIDGVVYARGVFYDTHHGRTAASMAESGSFNGVSIEPFGVGEVKMVELANGDIQWQFEDYEIGDLAVVTMPGFRDAGFISIELAEDGEEEPMNEAGEISALAASGSLPIEVANPEDDIDSDFGFGGLVASAALDEYPSDSFLLPESPVPMPLTVFDDLSFAGHLAIKDTCHIAYQDRCVRPPTSRLNYTPAKQGTVLLSTGVQARVARISMGSKHAPTKLNPKASADFYEREANCAGLADVIDGDIGIWVRGHINHNATEEQIARFAAAAWSGDWRKIRGHLELVGILSVNIPGFPIPDPVMWEAGGVQRSLVASGAREIAELDPVEPLEWAKVVHGREVWTDVEAEAKMAAMDARARSLGLPTMDEAKLAEMDRIAERVLT